MSSSLPQKIPDFLVTQPKMVEKVWGGGKLFELYGKGDIEHPWGESWEVADLPEGQCLIRHKDSLETLNTYVEKFGQVLVGNPCSRFPLLVKIIHAERDLSIQVHPGKEHLSQFPNAKSKDECWLILDAAPNAFIWHGLNDETLTQADLEKAISKGHITQHLRRVPVRAGDVISIPPGTAHAICKDIVLLELQEPSDTTFRLWDYNRPGLDGQPRTLHQKEGLQVIQFGPQPPEKVAPSLIRDEDHTLLLERPTFRMEKIQIEAGQLKQLALNTAEYCLFVCVTGQGTLLTDHQVEKIAKGQTVILPAQTQSAQFQASEPTTLIFGGPGPANLVRSS